MVHNFLCVLLSLEGGGVGMGEGRCITCGRCCRCPGSPSWSGSGGGCTAGWQQTQWRQIDGHVPNKWLASKISPDGKVRHFLVRHRRCSRCQILYNTTKQNILTEISHIDYKKSQKKQVANKWIWLLNRMTVEKQNSAKQFSSSKNLKRPCSLFCQLQSRAVSRTDFWLSLDNVMAGS